MLSVIPFINFLCLFDTDTARAPTPGAAFKACFISPGGWRFGIGAEGQFPPYPARTLTKWTSGYYFYFYFPVHRWFYYILLICT